MVNVIKSLILLVLMTSVLSKAKASNESVNATSLSCIETSCETFIKQGAQKFRVSFPLLEKKRLEESSKKMALSPLRLVHDLVHISLIQVPDFLQKKLQNYLIKRKLTNKKVNESLFNLFVSSELLRELKINLHFKS